MARKKIKIDQELYEKAAAYAGQAGYASVDEFVAHTVEKELAKIDQTTAAALDVEKKLRGLGYLS